MTNKRYHIIDESTGEVLSSTNDKKESRKLIRKQQKTTIYLKLLDTKINTTLLSIQNKF